VRTVDNLVREGFEISPDIEKYLNTCFSLTVTDGIEITCNLEPPEHNYVSFTDLVWEIHLVFDPEEAREECMSWYSSEVRKQIGDIFNYLKECYIVLGPTRWIPKTKNGNELTVEKMIEYFCPMYHEKFVERYFNDWLNEQMIKETEKNLGFSMD
jgi:hypothetical protein